VLTNAIRSAMSVEMDEAERIKHRLDGLQMINLSARSADTALATTQPILEELIREIKRTINYYQSLFAEGASEGIIHGLLLSGGTARMRNLDRYLEDRIQIPVQAVDVFSNRYMNVPTRMAELLGNDSASLAVAIGLGLREMMSEQNVMMAKRSRKTVAQRR
jgi:type IV pilus assembly protein PilM